MPVFIFFLTAVAVWINLPPLPKVPQTIKLFGRSVKVANLFPIKLGLDLQGGTELILQAQMDKIPADQKANALESARNIIERRVNPQGVSETIVQSSNVGNERRILVQLPGVTDLEQAVSLVSVKAELEFKELDASTAANLKQSLATSSAEATNSALIDILSSKPTGLTGADLKKAQVTFGTGKTSTGPQVAVEFTPEGSQKFADITKRNIGKPLAIFLDGQLLSAPIVQQEIIGGTAVISGNFTTEQAKSLAVELNAGALPVPVKIIENHTIPASLGNMSVQRSLIAGVIGMASVMLYIILYYGVFGVMADLALIVYSILVLAVFRTGLFIMPPVTLTLAGIAGFVLSIGMAVDANILTFERIKEEVRSGHEKHAALRLGFLRSWPSIRDSNVSSLITASILYALGTSVVRGFAVTLFIGVVVSIFSAIVVTRTLLRLIR